MSSDLRGWPIGVRALYGFWSWAARGRFHLAERLYESPDGSRAALLFAIGEIGVNKEVGRLAVFENKAAPRLIWRSRWKRFWYEGAPAEPVEFSPDGASVRVFELTRSWGGALGCRERRLDLAAARLL